MIERYNGYNWIYLKDNLRYIDKYMDLYITKEDIIPVTSIEPQVNKIISQEGNWLEVETWLGAKWINISLTRQNVILDVPLSNKAKKRRLSNWL